MTASKGIGMEASLTYMAHGYFLRVTSMGDFTQGGWGWPVGLCTVRRQQGPVHLCSHVICFYSRKCACAATLALVGENLADGKIR